MKKAEISMEMIVKVVIGLAVLLVVLGIFSMQSRKGSKGFDETSSAAEEQAKGSMCIGTSEEGNKLTCKSSCDEGTLVDDKKCLLPDTVCCEVVEEEE